MRKVFADTWYWVALLHTRDQYHALAVSLSNKVSDCRIVTTDECLIECLNLFSGFGGAIRQKAANAIRVMHEDPNVDVLVQSRDTFRRGLDFYEQRQDKGYSLTDCVSMNSMAEHELRDVLTDDQHFGQEGYNVLARAQDMAGKPSATKPKRPRRKKADATKDVRS